MFREAKIFHRRQERRLIGWFVRNHHAVSATAMRHIESDQGEPVLTTTEQELPDARFTRVDAPLEVLLERAIDAALTEPTDSIEVIDPGVSPNRIISQLDE